MTLIKEKFNIISNGFEDSFDITNKISTFASNSNIENGLLNIYTKYDFVSIISIDEKYDIKKLKEIYNNFFKFNVIENKDKDYDLFLALKSKILKNNLNLLIEEKNIAPKNQKIILIDYGNIKSNIEIVMNIII